MQEWLAHISQVQKETRKTIADKMKERFDCLKLPRYALHGQILYRLTKTSDLQWRLQMSRKE